MHDHRAELELVVARFEPGARLERVVELTGGVSAVVLGLEITTAAGDRRRVVYRRHRSAWKQHADAVTAKEYGLLAALHRRGLAVPEPYLHDRAGAGPYLILEWVDGATEVAAADLPAALEQMARFLVRLHALDPPRLQVPELRPVEDPRAAVVAHLPALEPALDPARRVRRALESLPPARGTRRDVVLHGDYWPGNVMWRDGRLVAVVDWEDACTGPALADLATARVELLCRHGPGAPEAFTARYLAIHRATIGALDVEDLPVWDAYVSAAALSSMALWGLAPEDEASRRERTGEFLLAAVERIEAGAVLHAASHDRAAARHRVTDP